jgi:hypothetical protein
MCWDREIGVLRRTAVSCVQWNDYISAIISIIILLLSYYIITSWDSAVGIATGYGLDDQGVGEFESQ